jgi:hypothetical protein
MAGSAPTYKEDRNAVQVQTGGTRRSPWTITCDRVSAPPEGAHDIYFSCHTGHRFFSALGRLRAHSNVVGSTQHGAGHSADATDSHGHRGSVISGQQPGDSPETLEDSTLPDRREVVMIMSEYEERFWSPTPSLHQTFAAIRGPKRRQRRSRRFWVAATLVGVMMMTCTVASHHTIHSRTGNGSQVWKSSVR